MLSQWLIVDEIENGVIGWLSLELRSHMTGTMNSYECKTISDLNITSDLGTIHVLNVVWPPNLLDVPVQFVDPLLGSICGHCTVCVTGVLQYLVSSLKNRVDPLRGILCGCVVKILWVSA